MAEPRQIRPGGTLVGHAWDFYAAATAEWAAKFDIPIV